MSFIRRWGLCLAVSAAVALLLQPRVNAQNLVFSIFESYLIQLQANTGIPALSAAIVQDGKVIWSNGYGVRSVEGNLPATADTPYPIADLTQTITAALTLDCSQRGVIWLDDPIGKWAPTAEGPGTTLRQLITHSVPGAPAGFRYSPARFALLAHPVEDCFDQPFRKVVALEVLKRLNMLDAVPGFDVTSRTAEFLQLFDDTFLEGYDAKLQRMAVPYKLDKNRRPVRSQLPSNSLDGSYGLIASVLDLAEFDKGLYDYLRPETLTSAWTNTVNNGVVSPFGMGWFVQTYQGEKLVWHFGYSADASSSLFLKVPSRRLTLILLANSDGLSAQFAFADGDVTSSHFARTFLRLFL